MGKKLNLESFNGILLSAGIDKKELLVMEIRAAYGLKIEKMEEMVDLSNKGEDFCDVLREINNIDSSLDYLNEQLKKIETLERAEEND